MRVGGGVARRRWAGGQVRGLDKLRYALGWLLLYRPLRAKLGLSRVEGVLSGAAPIAPQVLECFWAIGVPVREGYGQTENTAQATITPADDVRLGTVGKPVPGIELQHRRRRRDPHPGPGIFLGYFKDPEGHRRDRRRRRLAPHRRRRRARRRRLPQDHRPQEGHHHHGRRQEHQPVGDREQAQGLAVRARGDRDRRPAQVPHRAHRHRARHGRQLGASASASPSPPTPTCRRRSRGGGPDRRLGRPRSTPSSPRSRRSSAFALLPKELDQEDGELTATQKVKRKAIETEFASLIEAMYR